MVFEVGQFSPKFSIRIGNTELSEEVSRFITGVEFESADGLIDVVSIDVVNPRMTVDKSSPFFWTDRKLFYPGNELDLFMGYQAPLRHMARVRLVEPDFTFPESGTPTLTIKGFAPSYFMTTNEPAAEKQVHGEKGKSKKRQNTKHRILSTDIGKIIRDKCDAYRFIPDIDPVDMKLQGDPEDPNAKTFQRAGMSDYDLIKALANITGYIFWVDHFKKFNSEVSDKPVLHFLNPERMRYDADIGIQNKKYTFAYGDGDNSTLLSFQPTYTITGHANKMIAMVQNSNGKIIAHEVSFNQLRPDSIVGSEFEGKPLEKAIPAELVTAEQIKIVINDFSIVVVPVNPAATEAQLATFLHQWYERTREQFIQANGVVVGFETLLSRQVHRIKGIGEQFDGEYYFSRVRHKMSDSEGYTCEFSARKIIGEPPTGKTTISILDEVLL